MRKTIYISAICCLSAILAGCDKQMAEIPTDEVPAEGYILFGSKVDSRAALITDMNRDFSVTAFKYNNDVEWSTVVNTIQPNVFHNQSVSWNSTDKIHSYDPLVPWEANTHYAFFAHYPSTGVRLSGNTSYGTPYITYDLPTTVDAMHDVMTASVLNRDNSVGNTVELKFKHRMAAFGVQLRNMNDFDLTLNSLQINFEDLLYNQVTIPLDASMATTPTADGSVTQAYTLIPSTDCTSFTVPANSTVDFTKYLLLIPQNRKSETDFLNGTVTLNYPDIPNDQKTKEFDLETDLKEGRKYFLQLTFSKNAITIAIIESANWIDKNVDIEFE